MAKLLTMFSDITQLIEDDNINIDDDLLIKLEKQLLLFKQHIQSPNIDNIELSDGTKLKRGRKPKYTEDEKKKLLKNGH